MVVYNNSMVSSYFNMVDDVFEKLDNLSNSAYESYLITVLNNMKKISEEYPDFLNNVLQDGFRFSDYFSFNFGAEDLVDYFSNNYDKSNKDERMLEFMIFSLLKYLGEIFELYDETDFFDLCVMVDANNYYDKLIYLSSNLLKMLENSKWKKQEQAEQLPFLNNNRYKIFFTGLSLSDIEKLESHVKSQLIHKLTSPLASDIVIPHAEAVDHVKEVYNFPMHRIRLAYDYRIAFIRVDDVTAILGVTLKTGKDVDYTRYDAVARKDKMIYKEIEDFINGRTSADADHYKVLAILEDAFKKKNSKVQL